MPAVHSPFKSKQDCVFLLYLEFSFFTFEFQFKSVYNHNHNPGENAFVPQNVIENAVCGRNRLGIKQGTSEYIYAAMFIAETRDSVVGHDHSSHKKIKRHSHQKAVILLNMCG